MKVIFIVRLLGLICEIKNTHELTRDFNTEEATAIKVHYLMIQIAYIIR